MVTDQSSGRQPRRRARWDLNSRFVIGQPGNPMMERWRLLQTPRFGVYVHFIHREDLDPVPHDHPWQFWSLVLRGGYTEYLYPDARVSGDNVLHGYGRWSFHRFPQRSAHRIVSVQRKTITLVVVGRKTRTWGFWHDGTFTDYRDALGLRPQEGDARKRPRDGAANDPPVLIDHGADLSSSNGANDA